MALAECPECKAQVSDTVRHCPHCGFRLKKCCGHHDGRLMFLPLVLVGVVVILLLAVFFTATVSINSNNGMINFHWNKRGIFPRLGLKCLCGCGKRGK
jgi:hypothetical protein